MMEQAEEVRAQGGDDLRGITRGAIWRSAPRQVVMPRRRSGRWRARISKDRFVYDESSDSYRCPEGGALAASGEAAVTWWCVSTAPPVPCAGPVRGVFWR